MAAVLTSDLVRACAQEHIDIGHRSHTTADGERDEHLLGGALDDLEHGGPACRRRGDVKESQLVGTLAVVGSGELDGIASITQVFKVDALDDPTVVDVQAGDDADRDIHQ